MSYLFLGRLGLTIARKGEDKLTTKLERDRSLLKDAMEAFDELVHAFDAVAKIAKQESKKAELYKDPTARSTAEIETSAAAVG